MFAHDVGIHRYAETENAIIHWVDVDGRGGHFAALEEPRLLTDDIRTFFRDLDVAPERDRLPLFFDLVFVFALTQVTATMAANLTARGVAEGMIAGIVLLALGLKKVLEYVGDEQGHELSDPLSGVGQAALVGGVVLYLLAHVAFKLRTVGVLNPARLVVALLLLPLVPAGSELPALVSLAILTGVVVALIAFETLRYAEDHERARRNAAHAPANG